MCIRVGTCVSYLFVDSVRIAAIRFPLYYQKTTDIRRNSDVLAAVSGARLFQGLSMRAWRFTGGSGDVLRCSNRCTTRRENLQRNNLRGRLIDEYTYVYVCTHLLKRYGEHFREKHDDKRNHSAVRVQRANDDTSGLFFIFLFFGALFIMWALLIRRV